MRKFIVLSISFILISILVRGGNEAMNTKDKYNIPGCAWHRTLGDRPYDIRTKKGIPLGGIGAGNFMYNISGSFGPWRMKTRFYEERFLSQAAFHIREEVDGIVTYRTLATEDVLPAWEKLEPGDGDYYALFPRGWTTYNCFDNDISMQFFSPIIKNNYKETSLPVAVFEYKVQNTGDKPATISIMFTFPNSPEFAGKDQRMGLKNSLWNKPGNTSPIILMTADDARNSDETQHSEWAIATSGGTVSHVSEWNGAGDGADIIDDFKDDGILSNKPLAKGSSIPSGALSVTVELKPGESRIIPFTLAWHFPKIQFGSGTQWWKKYTQYYPGTEREQAALMAKDALKKYPQWLEDVNAWTGEIAENPAYPEWLKQGALNELYYTTFGGSFWENGCITKDKIYGNRPGQHLHSTMECLEYAYAETFDVRHHTSRSYRNLWPEIERDILLAYGDIVMANKSGNVGHDAGSPWKDPWFSTDHYGKVDAKGRWGVEYDYTAWSEFSPKLIQQSYAYYVTSGDDGFLKEIWPALTKTFHYQITTDTNNDGLTEMSSSEYKNNKLFNATLWIGALEMMTRMAEAMNDSEILRSAQQQLAKARPNAEEQLWDSELGYYKFNEQYPALMADAFLGQRFVDATGLPGVLDKDRMTSHYTQCFNRLVKVLPDFNGDGIGDMGIANCKAADGTTAIGVVEVANYPHPYEVWLGCTYNLAANMVDWGQKTGNGALQAQGLLAGWGAWYQTWSNDETAYWFDSPEAWRYDDPTRARARKYQRVRAIWELLMAVYNPYQKELNETAAQKPFDKEKSRKQLNTAYFKVTLSFEDGTVLQGNTRSGGQLDVRYKGRIDDRTSENKLGQDGKKDHVLLVKGFAEIKRIRDVHIADGQGGNWIMVPNNKNWPVDAKQEMDELYLTFSAYK